MALIFVENQGRIAPILRGRIGDGRVFAENPALPPLCRPAGWMALWRRLGAAGVLNRRGAAKA